MVRKREKPDTNGEPKGDEKTGELEADLDALFSLPLAEFTAARNTLAGQWKQGGRRSEADLVKALVKPSVTAWAVNQLYFKHREEFDRLIATGELFRQTQTSRIEIGRANV